MLQAAVNNKLVHHPAYAKILSSYNELLQKNGKVNNKKFYEQVILPEIPDYHIQSWYQFLRRFKTSIGLQAASSAPEYRIAPMAKEMAAGTAITMLSNQEATQRLIQSALSISAAAAKQLMDDPTLLNPEKRMELGLKAMKAQDGRVRAIGRIREDNREQEKFDRAFSGAQYA